MSDAADAASAHDCDFPRKSRALDFGQTAAYSRTTVPPNARMAYRSGFWIMSDKVAREGRRGRRATMESSEDKQKTLSDVGEQILTALGEVARSAEDALVRGPSGVSPSSDASEVRVFDIRHIKGLEFEAVFFIGVDRLAERIPDLFLRFLYVGITRAATYLGLTCEGNLPKELEPVRARFAGDGWATAP
jgi:hypothetical protein